MNKLAEFLKRIAPYVVLCGSWARGEETESSDLDFYVRQKPQNSEEEPLIDTSYLPDIIQIVEEFGYSIDSCVIGSITLTEETTKGPQLEFSSLYRLPKNRKLKVRVFAGVPFITCVDDKTTPFDSCYEALSDEGEIQNPLPDYEAFIVGGV